MSRCKRVLTILVVALSLGATAACAPMPERRGTGEYVDDKAINTRVRAALLKDADIDSRDVNVDTFRGVVQLSGFVRSRSMAERAVKLTQGVAGVREVRNDLQVREAR
jgi:osmotically-inducible protein OsmY